MTLKAYSNTRSTTRSFFGKWDFSKQISPEVSRLTRCSGDFSAAKPWQAQPSLTPVSDEDCRWSVGQIMAGSGIFDLSMSSIVPIAAAVVDEDDDEDEAEEEDEDDLDEEDEDDEDAYDEDEDELDEDGHLDEDEDEEEVDEDEDDE